MPRIKILSIVDHGQPQPVFLNINGVETELPVNTDITVTDEQFLALGHTDHNIEILVEGETAADEAEEQAPAPAGSGDGGDAGGGGDSGEAATETSEAGAPGAPEGENQPLVPAEATHDPSQPEQTSTPETETTEQTPIGELEVALPEGFHDRSVDKIAADIPNLNLAQLHAALALEEGGKTRRTLVTVLKDAIASHAA
jgi:hypothetical protein